MSAGRIATAGPCDRQHTIVLDHHDGRDDTLRVLCGPDLLAESAFAPARFDRSDEIRYFVTDTLRAHESQCFKRLLAEAGEMIDALVRNTVASSHEIAELQERIRVATA